MLSPYRLGILATPDAVASRPVAQLSIPINGNFEIVRGEWPLLPFNNFIKYDQIIGLFKSRMNANVL